MSNIFENYIGTINKAIASDKARQSFSKGLSGLGTANESFDAKAFLKTRMQAEPPKELISLASSVLGGLKTDIRHIPPGSHPDFSYLKSGELTENHYIVTSFIDIKNSTNLFKKYLPDTVFIITNTIQKLAIHINLAFGGYVHRLQGDGLMVYFGGKGIDKAEANKRAVAAAGIFSYFMENDLKRIMNEEGIEKIYTRIGIDYGDDIDVLWAKAGINDCSEITTYSLHTSLASKMQSWAGNNGIVVGENVKNIAGFPNELYDLVRNSKGEVEQRYIFEIPEKNFRYTQYVFSWQTFVRRLDFLAFNMNGEITLKGIGAISATIITKNPEALKPMAEQSTPWLSK